MGSSRFTGKIRQSRIHPEANPPMAHWQKTKRNTDTGVKDRTRKYDIRQRKYVKETRHQSENKLASTL